MYLKNFRYSGTLFNIDFKNKINILLDYSGTGKSFMMEAIHYYCSQSNISCSLISYSNREDIIENNKILRKRKVLLFDRADLYFNNDLFNNLKSEDAISIISLKDTEGFDMSGDVGFYELINSGDKITVNRWR